MTLPYNYSVLARLLVYYTTNLLFRDTHHEHLCAGPSDNSLDVYIPSYPGSPRSLSIHSLGSDQAGPQHGARVTHAATTAEIEAFHLDHEWLVAAETGNEALLKQFISQKVDLYKVDHVGRTALHLAVQSGVEGAIRLLLQAGLSPSIKDNLGMSPLSLSLFRRPSYKIAKLLFEYGAKILPRSSPMDTGLFIQFVMMCQPTYEEEKIIRLLVANGAIVNDPGAPGKRQALHFAAMSNNCKLIDILVELGADIHARNHRNETPLEVAKIFKCGDAVNCLTRIEANQRLRMEEELKNNKNRKSSEINKNDLQKKKK